MFLPAFACNVFLLQQGRGNSLSKMSCTAKMTAFIAKLFECDIISDVNQNTERWTFGIILLYYVLLQYFCPAECG